MDQHEFIDSKFRLVILAAKRARQLLRGGRKKVDIEAENSLTIALEEINRGLINYEITDGTPREPDLSIFGDSDETGTAEGGEETEAPADESEPVDEEPAAAEDTATPEESVTEEEVEETQPAAE